MSLALPLRLVLVRHGETEGESSIRYHGRTDVPLSAMGRRQMEQVRAALNARRFAAVYASTLLRSTEAARIISDGRSSITAIGGFDEIDFGAWEGLTAEEIRLRHATLYAQWQTHSGDFRYPGGESSADFRVRVVRALREVLMQSATGELLFVLHKGVIRCILTELLALAETERRTLTVALGSIHIVARERDSWRAEALDSTAHLLG